MARAKAVILAPFWRQPRHAGLHRVEGMVRWLCEADHEVCVVCAGPRAIVDRPWGCEVGVPDPTRLHPGGTGPPRQYPQWLELGAYALLTPDPTVLWSHWVSYSRRVRRLARGASILLSSSPPEAPHLSASRLAQRLGARFVMDMRDGWLDEPLKPLLRTSRLQRWREARLERRLTRRAAHIFVTSDVWQERLTERLPLTRGKTTVLYNWYPSVRPAPPARTPESMITLLHSGRLTGSSPDRTADRLLEPLLRAASAKARLVLRGSLTPADRLAIERFREPFAARGWQLEIKPPIDRLKVQSELRQVDGLLLLSASAAAIPSKLFEYLPARRPILALTPRDSALWRILESVPQATCVDEAQSDGEAVGRFLDACRSTPIKALVPERFTQASARHTFLKALRLAP